MAVAVAVAGLASDALAGGVAGLDFTNDWVTMGPAPGLGTPTFTLETWFRIDGPGSWTWTGYGGIGAIPLISKGTTQNGGEGNTLDMNYILALVYNGKLAADLEDQRWGQNHPVVGATTVTPNVWHHGAVTYDGAVWRLYLDGSLDAWNVAELVPRSNSLLHFGLGSALNSLGQPAGFFDGAMDEARVWNYARSAAEIRSTINHGVPKAPGLIGRWALNEGKGKMANDSSGYGHHGAIIGALYGEGAPFNLDLAPEEPLLVGPTGSGAVTTSTATLQVMPTNPEGGQVGVTFLGRPRQPPRPGAFTIAVIPDTQYYLYPPFDLEYIFDAQIDWIMANREALNIVYVAHAGDIVQADWTAEWVMADQIISQLETVPDLPYTLAVGNHDGTNGDTTLYNMYFPVSRYEGVFPWYGGHYGDNNDNNYALFSAGGIDFLGITTEYCAPPEVLEWADGILAAYPDRLAIVVSHNVLEAGNPGAFNNCGTPLYNALKDNPNLFMILAGHVPGEGRRTDVFNGNTVHTLLADYQSRINGGNGWLRLIELAPGDPEIRVRTFSPLSGQYETDADSEFSLNTDTPGGPFMALGTVAVPSGTTAAIPWPDLAEDQTYEWKAVVSDGVRSATGPVWSFHVSFQTGDLTGDGKVDVQDLLGVMLNWGPCQTSSCPGDANGDGMVDVIDLVTVITNWS
jgi:hypothetical protein